jgi:two-component system sensor histidine kinase TctE
MIGVARPLRSIRGRILLQLFLGAVVLSLLVFVIFREYARDLAAQSQDNILAASVTMIRDAASVQNGQLNVDIPYSAFSILGNFSEDRVFYAVYLNEEFLTGYENLPRISPLTGANINFATDIYDAAEIRVASTVRSVSVNGVPAVLEVLVAQTREHLRATLHEISLTVSYLGISFFVLVAALGFITTHTSLRPLNTLAVSVSRRGPGDLRPVQGAVPHEMTPLVQALNGFILRLKSSLSRSEDLITEAAHRIRTPLAEVRAQAEMVLLRLEKPQTREELREMIKAIDEGSRSAGQLLDHAMVTFRAENLQNEPVDFGRLLRETVERQRPTADLRDMDISLSIPDKALTGSGDAILLQSAILNIIDNAIKFAPPESVIDISMKAYTRAEISFTEIMVVDKGSGFPADIEIKDLAKRFVRGRNTQNVVGSGLGLTIASEVAAAHGGFLHLENSEGGGACAKLYFALS